MPSFTAHYQLHAAPIHAFSHSIGLGDIDEGVAMTARPRGQNRDIIDRDNDVGSLRERGNGKVKGGSRHSVSTPKSF